MQAIVNSYRCALRNLQTSSKHMIDKITDLARKYQDHADTLVQETVDHLLKSRKTLHLPIIRLIDSIAKKIGNPYADLFSVRMDPIYDFVLSQIQHREDMLVLKRLKTTWQGVFKEEHLGKLDEKIAEVEPKFPVPTKPESEVAQIEEAEASCRRKRLAVGCGVRKRLSDSFEKPEGDSTDPRALFAAIVGECADEPEEKQESCYNGYSCVAL